MNPWKVPFAHPVRSAEQVESLVESRMAYTFDQCELNVFQTLDVAHQVHLQFHDPVVATMLRGKKVMHLREKQPFEFFPGESVLMSADEIMCIDFPEAGPANPTQCIALAISQDFISKTLHQLEEQFPKVEESGNWEVDLNNYHFMHNQEISGAIGRLLKVVQENHSAKSLLASCTLQELLIRLMHTQARALLLESPKAAFSSHRFAFLAEYIRNNLTDPLSIDSLSERVCMSKPHFFRMFKREFGLSPVEYVIAERIRKASELLATTQVSISQIGYSVGFNAPSHFISSFRKRTGMTPAEYRSRKRPGAGFVVAEG